MNINNIISSPTSFRTVNTWYAVCHKDGTIYQEFSTLASALYIYETIETLDFIQEVFKERSKIVSIGEILKQKGENL